MLCVSEWIYFYKPRVNLTIKPRFPSHFWRTLSSAHRPCRLRTFGGSMGRLVLVLSSCDSFLRFPGTTEDHWRHKNETSDVGARYFTIFPEMSPVILIFRPLSDFWLTRVNISTISWVTRVQQQIRKKSWDWMKFVMQVKKSGKSHRHQFLKINVI